MKKEIDYSIYYKRWHAGGTEQYYTHAENYRILLDKELEKYKYSINVLDFGCGFGGLVFYLKSKFENVIGVDSSEAQVSVAKKNNLPVSKINSSEFGSWCEVNQQSFDLVFLFDVLEHVAPGEQIDFVYNLSRTLKNDGTLYVKVPNANSPMAMRWRYNDWTHHASFTESSLDFVLLNSGFNNIQYLRDDSSLVPRYWWIPRPNIAKFYLKSIFRFFWKIYLFSEIGDQVKNVSVGYNLFARASKD